jgi:N-acetyltransferase
VEIETLVLRGALVRLEPLAQRHVPGLAQAAEAAGYVEGQLSRAGVTPFAQVRVGDATPVGCTAYCNPRPWPGSGGLSAVEIGGTWLSGPAQRSGINTEAKLLLLTHAFETLLVARADFRTDARNERSRRAIERLGGRLEGVLRNWGPSWVAGEEGQLRDSALYSITEAEWPGVKAGLTARLTRG